MSDPGGLGRWRTCPPDSVDFCFSNAGPRTCSEADLALIAAQLLRVLNRNGICVHRVHVKDYLGGRLNNLRLSDATWEEKLCRSSGFYTNRIRLRRDATLFERAGFECHLPRMIRWEKLPTPGVKLNASFRRLPDEDLLVGGFDGVLRRKG